MCHQKSEEALWRELTRTAAVLRSGAFQLGHSNNYGRAFGSVGIGSAGVICGAGTFTGLMDFVFVPFAEADVEALPGRDPDFAVAFLRVALSLAFQALAAAFASLRACLANFLAALCALRASLNLALANRAMLRAVSACFSASAARAASDAAPCLLRRLGVFGSWFFIIVATRGDGSVGRPRFGGGLRFVTKLWQAFLRRKQCFVTFIQAFDRQHGCRDFKEYKKAAERSAQRRATVCSRY